MPDQTTESTNPSGFVSGMNRVLPMVQWALSIIAVIGLFALATRDTQKDQSFSIQKLETGQQQLKEELKNKAENRDRQIEALRKEMLTREVFEAHMVSIKNEQEQQRRLSEKILENMK